MCSNPEERVAALGRAIDELASQARAATSRGDSAGAGGPRPPDASRRAGVRLPSPADSAGQSERPDTPGHTSEPRATSASDVLAASNRAGERSGSRAPGEHEVPASPDRACSPNDPAAPKPPGAPGAPGAANAAASSDVLNRLAALWAELATLDPEVAKRLPTYEA